VGGVIHIAYRSSQSGRWFRDHRSLDQRPQPEANPGADNALTNPAYSGYRWRWLPFTMH